MGVDTIKMHERGPWVYVPWDLYARINAGFSEWQDSDLDVSRPMFLQTGVPVSLDMVDHYRGLRDTLSRLIDLVDAGQIMMQLPDGRHVEDWRPWP